MKSVRPKMSGILMLLVLMAAGCGGDPLGRQAIDGSVTLDGTPLSHGNVRFEPQTVESPISAGAVIDAGKFRIGRERGLPPGVYRVSISCPQMQSAIDQQTDAGGQAQELVPERYNRNTELTATVTSDGTNMFQFELSTSPSQ